MRHNRKGHNLGVDNAHRDAMLRNLATSLFKHGSIKTTLRRAKEARPFAERLISYAISGTLADKRLVLKNLFDRAVAHHLINDIAPELKNRVGGYTRIIKLGNRDGDGAKMAILEIVAETTEMKRAESHKKKKAEKKAKQKAIAKEKEKEEKEKPEREEESEEPHDREKVHARDELTKEHLSSKPQKMKNPGLPNRNISRPKNPPPSGQEG